MELTQEKIEEINNKCHYDQGVFEICKPNKILPSIWIIRN